MEDLIIANEVLELGPGLTAEDFLQPSTSGLAHFKLRAIRQVCLEGFCAAFHLICLHGWNVLEAFLS